VYKSLKSETHGQCDAIPTVTFPAAWDHSPVTGKPTKLYQPVPDAYVCAQIV